MAEFPVCPDCGERHDPEPQESVISKETYDAVSKRVTKLLSVLSGLDPEFSLRVLISMLSSAVVKANTQTKQNVVRSLGQQLGLNVLFGIPKHSAEALAAWKPAGPTDPKETN